MYKVNQIYNSVKYTHIMKEIYTSYTWSANTVTYWNKCDTDPLSSVSKNSVLAARSLANWNFLSCFFNFFFQILVFTFSSRILSPRLWYSILSLSTGARPGYRLWEMPFFSLISIWLRLGSSFDTFLTTSFTPFRDLWIESPLSLLTLTAEVVEVGNFLLLRSFCFFAGPRCCFLTWNYRILKLFTTKIKKKFIRE